MPTRPDLSRLTTSQLYELTGRDRRWIKKRLAEKGIEPAAETARERRYQARPALEAIYAVDGLDPAQEQARLARARAEAAEFDLAVKRGEHVPAGDLEVALIALASMTQQRILAVPHRTAAELAADSTTAGCYRIVETALNEALHALADAMRDGSEAVAHRERYLAPRLEVEVE